MRQLRWGEEDKDVDAHRGTDRVTEVPTGQASSRAVILNPGSLYPRPPSLSPLQKGLLPAVPRPSPKAAYSATLVPITSQMLEVDSLLWTPPTPEPEVLLISLSLSLSDTPLALCPLCTESHLPKIRMLKS